MSTSGFHIYVQRWHTCTNNIRSVGCTAALLSAWHCGNGELPEDATSTTAGLNITYDGKEGSSPGWLKCAPPECRLAHVHPGVC